MGLVFNDTTLRQGGIQFCEDTCGLGATGITSSTELFQRFTRDCNMWNKKGASYAILAFDGHDFDDPNYTTAPTGTFAGLTTRDYNFDGSYKMLKVKKVEVSVDGTNYVTATAFDDVNELTDISVKDPNVDKNFSEFKYDLIANGFKLYPAFTAAQVSAGAKVYVEWFRAPREFATSGTDAYEPGFDLQFHYLPFVGASYEYCKTYKPEVAASLRVDLYGGQKDGATVPGLLKELKDWYSRKQPQTREITGETVNSI